MHTPTHPHPCSTVHDTISQICLYVPCAYLYKQGATWYYYTIIPYLHTSSFSITYVVDSSPGFPPTPHFSTSSLRCLVYLVSPPLLSPPLLHQYLPPSLSPSFPFLLLVPAAAAAAAAAGSRSPVHLWPLLCSALFCPLLPLHTDTVSECVWLFDEKKKKLSFFPAERARAATKQWQ